MVFSSAIFLFVFLPFAFIVYYILPSLKARNLFLACVSLVFISFGQLVYIPVFLLSVLVNYLSGLLIMGGKINRKAILWISVILNLGVLGFFKYTDFVIQNLNLAFGLSMGTVGLALPIGISFYTFQGMSYTIDVYRDPESGTKNFTKILLYIALFPQLIAGPIVKYHDISLQIDSRESKTENVVYGIRRFIFGLSKKVLIANAAGYIADAVLNGSLYSDYRLAWLGALCYMIQIYYDFSGYSDMAIGIGHMFGFVIKENFLHPYGADSMIDFWRRWHVSLSVWFREYLYIPLGGNRRGKARTVINRIIVFFCTGLWHGANWTFVVWGLAHGLLTSLENIGIIPTKKLNRSVGGKLVCKAYVLLSVMLLFVLFRADSIAVALEFISGMFSLGTLPDGAFRLGRLLTPAVCCCLIFAIALAGNLPEKLKARFGGFAQEHGIICTATEFTLLLLCIMSISRGGFNPFIYFQF